MIDKSTLARPYARAAFEYADADNALKAWHQFLKNAALIIRDQALIKLIQNPEISKTQLFQIIVSVLGEKNTAQPMQNFLHLLVVYRRINIIPEILSEFSLLLAEKEKTIDVCVTSSYPLSGTLQAKLTKALEKRLQRGVFLKTKVDPSLIGGAVIRAGDFVIDGSIKSQLSRLQTELAS